MSYGVLCAQTERALDRFPEAVFHKTSPNGVMPPVPACLGTWSSATLSSAVCFKAVPSDVPRQSALLEITERH
jgi:hypothetical protein